MKWIELFDFFLFDFDGVLVDTEPLHFEAYQQVCQNMGVPWIFTFEQYCEVAHGESKGIQKALLRQRPDLDVAAITAEKKTVYLAWLKSRPLMLMPGVERVLQELQSQKKLCCVVTNSDRQQVESIKKSLPILQSIPHWITRDDCEQSKPSPEGYLKAIERHAPSSDCKIIGFEDTLKGFQALSQAIAHAVLICPAHRPHVSTCIDKGGKHFSSFESISDDAFNR